jgi:hypothetical protein
MAVGRQPILPALLVGVFVGIVAPAPLGAEGASRIINFWRVDCAPCLHELAILPQIAARHPAIVITLLTLKDDGRAAQVIALDPHPNLQIESFAGDEADLLARYGNPERKLPFSVALDAAGKVCARRVGMLGTDIVDAWAAQC